MDSIKNVYLLADLEALEKESDKAKEHIYENCPHVVDIKAFDLNIFDKETRVLLFISDDEVKKIMPELAATNCKIGFLPHPDGKQTISGYQVPKNLIDAFDELVETERVIQTGVLCCNNEVVLNYVVIGEMVTFLTKKSTERGIIHRLRRFYSYLKRLVKIKALPFTFQTEDKDPVETAATDVLIVQFAHNSVVSRVFASNEFTSEKLFHTFIFSPRSVLQLVKSYVMKMLLGTGQKNRDFTFLSRLKTEDLCISSNQKFRCHIDGRISRQSQLNFSFVEDFNHIPSESIVYDLETKDQSGAKSFQTKHLPKGGLKKEMVRKHLPFISHASADEYKELFKQLRENARPSQNYVVLMILSVILATLGVFADSSPVIIGAMILAPLMSPIISFSMGVLRQDRELMKNSFITILVGIGVGYLFAIIFTLITPLTQLNGEITSRIKPNIIDLGIAVISGAAGAYAYSKEEIAKTLAGVAIAVALVPPLAVSGIGVAWLNFDVFFGAFLLLITNLTGMVLAASLVFLLTGYSPFQLARKGILISLFVVLSISIPLGYGFFKVVEENKIIRSLNETEINGMVLEKVVMETRSPMVISLDVVSDHVPEEEEIDKIKYKIEKMIGEEVLLKAAVRVKR
ncbi:TIGR00341 family protein [Brumimicrobium aurantiacum]|uniref:TIGR00341 family protein n=1 Tax=Brumimicrobium aurantiacum TaxID=1737063 RepID=A0A3E1EVH6_9FLAO|nr:TIGR00341 family protein [Brumimicrobium aurantiacum]RFC53559.1 TIGR00341 family protein [Brumimicrobium aurantiacum]